MGTTMEQVKAFMDKHEFKYRVDDERSVLLTGFATENYKDADGEHHLRVVIKLDEDGEYLALFVPKTYVCRPDHPSARAVLETAARMHWSRKLICWEYDHHDGEVRACVHLPLEDSLLTHRQFHRCLHGLIDLVDTSYAQFGHALDTGTCLDTDAAESLDPAAPPAGKPRRRPGRKPGPTPAPADIGLGE
jgi:hypothetical protein